MAVGRHWKQSNQATTTKNQQWNTLIELALHTTTVLFISCLFSRRIENALLACHFNKFSPLLMTRALFWTVLQFAVAARAVTLLTPSKYYLKGFCRVTAWAIEVRVKHPRRRRFRRGFQQRNKQLPNRAPKCPTKLSHKPWLCEYLWDGNPKVCTKSRLAR